MPKFDSIVTAPALSASGLTGATNGGRLVGGTASGAPTSGTFSVGDLAVSATGSILVCTSAGTPGTWATSANLSATALQTFSGPISATAVGATGLTGATTSTRHVGGTTGGAPTTGTFTAGDYLVTTLGQMLVCTVGGTPGTWVQVGGGGMLLGKTVYAPASYVTYTVGTAFAALDTTNLTVSFTAPSSGAVTVRLTAQLGFTTSSSISWITWGLLSGGAQIGPQVQAAEYPSVSAQFYPEVTTDIEVTGLTPGTSYTFQWGAQASSAGQHVYAGPGGSASATPQAVMKVYDATVSMPAGSQINPSGGLLAAKNYNAVETINFSAAAWTYLYSTDTNIAITATAPLSGQLIVRFSGGVVQTNGGATPTLAGLTYEVTGTGPTGTPVWEQALGDSTNSTSSGGGGMMNLPYRIEALITGLTPGTSYTFYPAIYCGATNGSFYLGNATIGPGPLFGAVYDATTGSVASSATPTAPVVRSASATVAAWETTIGTAAETLTLPAAPVNGCTNVIIAQAGVQTITANTGQTINHYSTTGMSSLVIPAGMEVTLEFSVATSVWYVTSGGFVGNYPLAKVLYSGSGYAVSTTSLTAADSTNLTTSIVVPPSGAFTVRLQAAGYACTAASNTHFTTVGLLLHGTSTEIGDNGHVVQGDYTTPDGYSRSPTTIIDIDVTGQTPGTTIQFDWATACDSGSTTNGYMYGPFKMKVFAA